MSNMFFERTIIRMASRLHPFIVSGGIFAELLFIAKQSGPGIQLTHQLYCCNVDMAALAMHCNTAKSLQLVHVRRIAIECKVMGHINNETYVGSNHNLLNSCSQTFLILFVVV